MFEYEVKIRYSELDHNGNMRLDAILDHFQDCSIFHSESLGVGIDYLDELGLFWALSSWQIVIHRYPKLGEVVTIGTHPYEFKGFIGYRNFWMKDAEGNQLACANSIWSLIRREDSKPVKATQLIIDTYKLGEKIKMNYADRHIRFQGNPVPQEVVEVTKHHLDTNQHVNNGQYVKIAMDFLPMDYPIHQLRAEYKMQALLGTKMIPMKYEDENTIGISLQDEESKAYCNVEFAKLEKDG